MVRRITTAGGRGRSKPSPTTQGRLRSTRSVAKAYSSRGYIWSCKGDYEKAITDYSEAVRLNAANPDIYANRAYAYYQIGDYRRSVADYSEVIRRKPDCADAYSTADVFGTLKGITGGQSQTIRRPSAWERRTSRRTSLAATPATRRATTIGRLTIIRRQSPWSHGHLASMKRGPSLLSPEETSICLSPICKGQFNSIPRTGLPISSLGGKSGLSADSLRMASGNCGKC